jgi:hypothetical protein
MFAFMTGLFLQAAGADPESSQQIVDALLKITGISLAQHAIAAAAVVMIVGAIQEKFLAPKGWSKYTPAVAVLLGILYFFTPLAGLQPEVAGGEIDPMTRVMYGAVFGWAVIGGRSFIKNIKGDYDADDDEEGEE